MLPAAKPIMDIRHNEPDPNAELHAFEPLRVALAVGALLLGLLVGFF